MNQAGGNADSVAELAVGLILSVMRRIPESDRRMKTHTTGSREDLMGHELRGRTLGLVASDMQGVALRRLAVPSACA